MGDYYNYDQALCLTKIETTLKTLKLNAILVSKSNEAVATFTHCVERAQQKQYLKKLKEVFSCRTLKKLNEVLVVTYMLNHNNTKKWSKIKPELDKVMFRFCALGPLPSKGAPN